MATKYVSASLSKALASFRGSSQFYLIATVVVRLIDEIRQNSICEFLSSQTLIIIESERMQLISSISCMKMLLIFHSNEDKFPIGLLVELNSICLIRGISSNNSCMLECVCMVLLLAKLTYHISKIHKCYTSFDLMNKWMAFNIRGRGNFNPSTIS